MIIHLNRLKQSYRVLSSNILSKNRNTFCIMNKIEPNANGIPLKQVIEALENFASPLLASSWDNVGLLIEPTETKVISYMIVTNDLTENVMEEALRLKTDMIITYHLLIFNPMKSVTTCSWKEKIVAKCLGNRIAIYSPHTTFNSIKGGVNDWLVSAFENVLESSKPINVNENNSSYGFGRNCSLKNNITLEEAVQRVKTLTGLKHVRLARAYRTDNFIKTIAICAGSGASVLKNVPADLYLTGEMLHHDINKSLRFGTWSFKNMCKHPERYVAEVCNSVRIQDRCGISGNCLRQNKGLT